MKILVIEDDRPLAKSLQKTLAESFYEVDLAHTGEDGEYRAFINTYSLLILSYHLPDSSALTICQNLRREKIETPILVISKESSTDCKVAMLDNGADDFMTKPIDPNEFLARIRALIRRRESNVFSSRLKIADLILDEARHIVKRRHKVISLRRKEFGLLEYLMHNPGKVLTRPMILENVWGNEAEPMGNTIDVHVKALRDKVDRPFDKALIQTVPGVGYKIEG